MEKFTIQFSRGFFRQHKNLQVNAKADSNPMISICFLKYNNKN